MRRPIILSLIILFTITGISILIYLFIITPYLQKKQAEEAFEAIKKAYQYANSGDYFNIEVDYNETTINNLKSAFGKFIRGPQVITHEDSIKIWDTLTHQRTITNITYDGAIIEDSEGIILFKLNFKDGKQESSCHKVTQKGKHSRIWTIAIDPYTNMDSWECAKARRKLSLEP